MLTHSAAPSPPFEGKVRQRRSGSTLSQPQHLCWGVEGLTLFRKISRLQFDLRFKDAEL